jgi:hypothetical protein
MAVAMRRLAPALLVALALLAAPSHQALAAPLVRVELLAETRSIQPGQPFGIALHQQITPPAGTPTG